MTAEAETLSIRVPTDASLAVTLRVFVAESARTLGLDQASIDDLRLIATELLASAVEHAGDAIELTLAPDARGWRLTARGVGGLDGTPLGDLPIRRIDLLRGIADVEERSDEVIFAPSDEAGGVGADPVQAGGG